MRSVREPGASAPGSWRVRGRTPAGWVAGWLGIPAGLGVLFDARGRRRLRLALAGSVLVALLETVALTAVVPMLQVMLGAAPAFGVLTPVLRGLGWLTEDPSGVRLAIAVLGVFVLKSGLAIGYRWWVNGFVAEHHVATSSLIHERYLRAPLRERTDATSVVSVVTEATATVYYNVLLGALSAITELVTIASVLLGLILVMPVVAMLIVASVGSMALVLQWVVKGPAARAGRQVLEMFPPIYRATAEPIWGIKEVQVRGNYGWFTEAFGRRQGERAQAQRVANFLRELPKYVLELVFMIGVAVMVVWSLRQADPRASLGMIAVVTVAGFRVIPSVTRLLGSLNAIKHGAHAVPTVVEQVSLARAAAPGWSGRSAARGIELREHLQVRDLSFRYAADAPEVLTGVSVQIPAGSFVALVGSSGAGKTTLADLLVGLLQPDVGAVLVDGRDIREDLRSWQGQIGMVPQEVLIVDGSVRDNVTFGTAPPAGVGDPQQWLTTVLARAELDAVVAGLPDGVDSALGERGATLSGGQRQRVGLARALYIDPRVLVLDEATSALDNETEHRIAQTLAGLRGTVTVIVIAHRLSTVIGADLVVFLSGGRVAAVGTFEQVRASNAEFARLVRLGSLDGVRGEG